MFHCELSSRVFGTVGMTFHVVWHFGAGLGAYLGILSLENCRCVALGIPCRLNYVYCSIPVLELVHDEPSSKDD